MRLQIDDHEFEVAPGLTILEAARQAGVYIPRLCWHPDLVPGRQTQRAEEVFQGRTRIVSTRGAENYEGCGLCVVDVADFVEPVPACDTPAAESMLVRTTGDRLTALRRRRLADVLVEHPHACLTCAQQDGCSRTQCSANVPENERCCPLLGHCELQKVAAYVGLPEDLPRYRPLGKPIVDDEPFFVRNYNLCIACTRCVRVCNDTREVGSMGVVYVGDRPVVGMTAANSAAANCRYCGACVEVCPTGALTDRNGAAGRRDERQLVPCRSSCPAGIDVPRYLRHIAAGRFGEANAVIREKVPFPEVLGYVCFHPCEQICRRGDLNTPISICALKRIAAEEDTSLWKQDRQQQAPTGKRVAVVGSGPAGLTAAYFLARKGHRTVVVEALPEPGGMLRYGILPYRLPHEVLDKEIAEILDAGVELRTDSRINLHELRNDGFDAILLATGAHGAKRLHIEGAHLEGVVQGVELLRDVVAGTVADDAFAGQRVVVIGGGNVAMDAARAVRRLGAAAVNLVCLEQRDQMPAYDWEVQSAVEEHVTIRPGWGPKRFSGNGAVSSVELRRCIRVFDEAGQFDPAYDDSETTTLEADAVVVAIGQSCELEYLDRSPVRVNSSGTIDADDVLQTGLAGVFAAGDVRHGPASVIEAITDGRRAAESIDRHLGGDGRIDEQLIPAETPDPRLGPCADFAERDRPEMPVLPVESRMSGFHCVELGYSPEQAAGEAGRCLQCDLRTMLHKPEFPPDPWRTFDAAGIEQVPPDLEGVYLLADAEKRVIRIKGSANVRTALRADVEGVSQARYFRFEEDRLYTKRESELLQQYMQEHGTMPGGEGEELDDLF